MGQNKNENKLLYIVWMILPIAIACVIQFVASMIVMQLQVTYLLGTFKGSTFTDLFNGLFDMVLSSLTNGVIYCIYSVVGISIFAYFFNSLFMKDKSYSIKGVSCNKGATFLGIILFSIGMQYVSNYLLAALSVAFPEWMEEYEQLLEAAGISESISPLMLVYALLLGPIVEEFMFRGLTLNAAKKLFNYKWAILIQAILFGVFHGNKMQGIYAFVLGLGLGYIMHAYDNLFFTIIIHMAYNIIGTLGAGYLPMGGDESYVSFFFWSLGSLVISYIGLYLLKTGAAAINKEEIQADI